MKIKDRRPAQDGYYFPAEWMKHEATWLSWPHKEESWPGKIEAIYAPYAQFIATVAEGEKVRINVKDEAMKNFALRYIHEAGADMANVEFYYNETNDAWCRDHGGAVLLNKNNDSRAVVNWGYNAWGDKYPPYDKDNLIPGKMAETIGVLVYDAPLIMEGGSVEFNGEGTLLTTTACLLNENRNPQYTREQIEEILKGYYGVNHILWLGDGIVGDDTDGHIDDITRFIDGRRVVTVVEENADDENYYILQENLRLLRGMRNEKGEPLEIIELPMPDAVVYDGVRLPASYANFYICNAAVVVPVFGCKNDERALEILRKCFTDRKVVGINSVDIIWGLGSFHCLSQQEPAAK